MAITTTTERNPDGQPNMTPEAGVGYYALGLLGLHGHVSDEQAAGLGRGLNERSAKNPFEMSPDDIQKAVHFILEAAAAAEQ